jgi:hypothetical protein
VPGGDDIASVAAILSRGEDGVDHYRAGMRDPEGNEFDINLLYGGDVCDGEWLLGQAWRTWNRASRPRYRRWMH